jgi:hypothetical protein
MQLQTALTNIKKCYVSPDKIYRGHLKDNLKFDISITVINIAIEKGVVGADTVEKYIKGELNDIVFP